jgi:hypothetical protein
MPSNQQYAARTNIRQIAIKAETTAGIDAIAGTPASSDYVTCRADIAFQYDQFPNTAGTNTYDELPPIPGAARATVTLRMQMVGSGVAGTPPEWGKLLPGGAMIQTITATPITGTATAGSASTVTLPVAFSATANAYQGMPILLGGNPAGGSFNLVGAYTTARLAYLTGATYSPVLSTATSITIPANVLYSPTSNDDNEKWFTLYLWQDEIFYSLVGAKVVGLQIQLTSGAPAEMTVTLTGMVAQKFATVARPSGYTPVTRSPPIWRAASGATSGLSASRLNAAVANVRQVTFDLGLTGSYMENPEAINGYDPPILTKRAIRIRLDPFQHAVETPLRAALQDSAVPVPYVAVWGAGEGNRFALMSPSLQLLDHQSSARNDLGVDSLTFAPTLPDGGLFLVCF